MTPNSFRILNTLPRLALYALLGATFFFFGCSARTIPSTFIPGSSIDGPQLRGNVHGGQQPISGANITLYAASTSGYGTPATPLLTSPVTTDASGNFDITSLYTCATPEEQVYLVATGGDPGSGPNNNVALMTALGNCGDLTPSAVIRINEVTTVAAVLTLAPFITPGTFNVASTSQNAGYVAFAIATARNVLADPATGLALPGNGTLQQAKLNSLADSLASCINAVTASSLCVDLYHAVTPQGAVFTPADTIAAVLEIANNPSTSVIAIFNMASPTPPFLPALASPPADWTFQFPVGGGNSGNAATGSPQS